ncbi:MAG: NAD(P)H-binding protein [Bacteroides sp.]|nr:NAD(P)H-binding protein [Bacteroides sp.]
MKILILGAAGELAAKATDTLLKHTDANLVLYARDASNRVKLTDKNREQVIDGDFKDTTKLEKAMNGADWVFIDSVEDKEGMQSIVKAMKATGVKKLIAATSLGIYGEVPGKFGEWNQQMLGDDILNEMAESTAVLENPDLDYTLLRMAWLYNEEGNSRYELTERDEPFKGTQVTREAVAQLVLEIVQSTDNRFAQRSLGVSEPDTEGDKPSFYE